MHTIAEAQNIIEKPTGIRRSRPQIWQFLRRLGMKYRKIAAVPGCDGTHSECPRSEKLEKRLGVFVKEESAPMLWITALVHPPMLIAALGGEIIHRPLKSTC